VAQAQQFTAPVVISTLHYDGSVQSAVGAYVIVNDGGWILTAAHVFEAELVFPTHQNEIAAYEAGKRAKRKVPGLRRNPKWLVEFSLFWGRVGVSVADVMANFEIDLAVARLHPFDPAWVTMYPTFKDPTDGILPGTSLCRLGFPFHEFKPTHKEGGGFELPAGALPAPLFPLEGIMTRHILGGPTKDGKHQIKFLETSSPGLRGQSGGPIFDREGRVWGIQSRTSHLALGFNPPVPGGAKDAVEHQFLNVGWAVHPEVVHAFLKDNGVGFDIA